MLSRDNISNVEETANNILPFENDWKSQAKVLTIGCLLAPVSIAVYAAAIIILTPIYLLSKYSR